MPLQPAGAALPSPHDISLLLWLNRLDYWAKVTKVSEINHLQNESFRNRPNPESVLMTSQEYVEFRKGRFVDVTV